SIANRYLHSFPTRRSSDLMLLVKVALSDMGFVLGVTEATVLEWLRRAAQKAHEINAHLLRDLPVTQVQLDEMWNFIRRKHAQQRSEEHTSELQSRFDLVCR